MQSASRSVVTNLRPYNSGFRTRRDTENAVWEYGFDPSKLGHESYTIREGQEIPAYLPSTLKPGDLVVKADANLPINLSATNQPNFLRVRQFGDTTYYMFAPLEKEESVQFVATRSGLRIEVGRPVNIEIRQQGNSLVIVAVNPETGDEVERYVM